MARKTIHHKHGKPRASLRCSAGDLILVDDGLKCVNCEVLVVEHLAEETGIDRDKLIAESARHLAVDRDTDNGETQKNTPTIEGGIGSS